MDESVPLGPTENRIRKQNANQLSGKLGSLVFTGAMEQASRESNNRELMKLKSKNEYVTDV